MLNVEVTAVARRNQRRRRVRHAVGVHVEARRRADDQGSASGSPRNSAATHGSTLEDVRHAWRSCMAVHVPAMSLASVSKTWSPASRRRSGDTVRLKASSRLRTHPWRDSRPSRRDSAGEEFRGTDPRAPPPLFGAAMLMMTTAVRLGEARVAERERAGVRVRNLRRWHTRTYYPSVKRLFADMASLNSSMFFCNAPVSRV